MFDEGIIKCILYYRNSIRRKIDDAKAKKRTIEAEKITGDNIYKILFYFDKMYAVMDEAERRHLMESLIDEIQIYEERQPNGQWLKSIRFKLPIIDEDMSLSLDNVSHIETVGLLSFEGFQEAETLGMLSNEVVTVRSVEISVSFC